MSTTNIKKIEGPEIAFKLSIARKLKNYSQQEVADFLCVSKQAVSNWESGRSVPGAVDMLNLITFLDMAKDFWPCISCPELEELKKRVDILEKTLQKITL